MEPLTSADADLVERARSVIERRGDGAIHTVAAAVRTRSGEVFDGVNLYHFTGGPCAELVALAAARTAGHTDVEVIVAVGDGDRGVVAPCGKDRQILADYHPDIRVLVRSGGDVVSATVTELLPFAFSWSVDDGTPDGVG